FTAWADVNNDGHLDLFITDEHDINHLFINNGFGEFENKSEKWGFNKQTISQGAAFADVNNDGWPDLYVCNWFAADHFYLNNNGEKFILQNLPISHLQESFSSNSSTFADINNDGKIDLIVCDRDGKSCIYLNQIDSGGVQPKFKKMTNCGLQNTLPAYGAIAADFNNNGYPDIYFTNIGPNKLFINRGNGNFILAKENDHLKSGQKSYYSTGAATADYDNDGDLDLFVANKDTICFLYTNPLQKTQNEKSIRIGLKSVHSNRDAIGSKIWLYEKETGEIAGYRQIQSGQGYLSTSEIVAHFGVKENIKYRLEVKFPSGIIKRKKNLQGGAFLTIHDEKGIMWDLYEGRQLILKKFHTPSFWKNFLLSSILIFAVAFFILTGHKRYKWTIRQSIFYYGGIILILYFNYIFYYKSGLTSVLYMQLSISGILMTMLLFLQERNYRTLLKRFSYRQKLLKFSQKLVTIKNKKELFEELVNTIYKNLKISFCAYYDFTLHNFLITAGDEFKNISSELSKKAEELYKDKNNDNITEFNLNKTGKFSNTVSLLLKMNENISGIMFLGPLLTGEKIKTEDLNLLEIIANQTSISMENINYIEETKELVKEITENKIRKEYIKELEEKNRKLNELYKNLQETQTQMIHQEKMAALGQLVAGVAHELNNPISFVYANMRELEQGISTINELISIVNNEISTPSTLDNFNARLKEMLSDKENLLFFEDLPQIIDESLEGSNRVKEIVKTLKNFSRIDESEFKEVNIHDGLDSTLLLIKNQLRDRIIVDKQYGNIPEIYCQP
ncbi:MAG: VCBS repeat-containing protein, partial [Calditrichia bacterium]|nr:VCBS repeat-containing protein [Calditrichia bacterium]